jgi:hypothetical protein
MVLLVWPGPNHRGRERAAAIIGQRSEKCHMLVRMPCWSGPRSRHPSSPRCREPVFRARDVDLSRSLYFLSAQQKAANGWQQEQGERC